MAPPDSALTVAPAASDARSIRREAERERDLLTSALRRAAPLALNQFRLGERTTARVWSKSDGSSVTEADLAVNDALKQFLLDARPDHGWLSEEEAEGDHAKRRLSHRRAFVLDPIDGTRSYIEGSEVFCLSLALVADGAPIAAAVFAPATGRMFDAALGGGARLNESVLGSQPRDAQEPPKIMALKRDLKPEHWDAPAPSAERSYMQPIAHRLCAVAAGEADGLIALKSTMEWDIAAADLIAREAGLSVTDAAGRALEYNKPEPVIPGLIAAPAPLHEDWLARGPRAIRR